METEETLNAQKEKEEIIKELQELIISLHNECIEIEKTAKLQIAFRQKDMRLISKEIDKLIAFNPSDHTNNESNLVETDVIEEENKDNNEEKDNK